LDAFLKDKGYLSKNIMFVTCGDWDLKTCLRKETTAKNIPYKAYLKSWINLKLVYPVEKKGDRIHGMTDMLKRLNLDLVGK
jgi:hypothetical protein